MVSFAFGCYCLDLGYSVIKCDGRHILDTGFEGHNKIGTWFLTSLRCIIRNMLELYKRCWQVFLPLFTLFLISGLQAFYYLDEYKYQWVIITILLILAVICLIIGITAFVYTFKDARRKGRESKAAKDYEALKESIRRVNPEWTEEQLEIATKGR